LINKKFRYKNITIFLKTNINDIDIDLRYSSKERIMDKSIYEEFINNVGDKTSNLLITKKENYRATPLPYNLSDLESDAATLFKYSAKKTMDITQNLRDKYKAITYNRSDCRYLSEEHFKEAPKLIPLVAEKLNFTATFDFNEKSRCFNDKYVTAHHGIIPTGAGDFEQFSQEEKNIYKLIAERYLIQFLEKVKIEKTEAKVEINEAIFKKSSIKILEPGYTKYFKVLEDDNENDEEIEVRFYGHVEEKMTEDGFKVEHKDYTSIQAEPYDLLISGYKTKTVNTLRLWEAKAKTGFNMKLFERGEYSKSSEAEAIASSISKLLYPADSTNEGKELRIKQQYFFISASLQQLVKNHYNEFGTLENLSEHVALHINDTHPAMGVPELMRLLLDEYGYSWDKAWGITTKTFAYTNHTIMAEALEKWSVDLFKPLLPRIYSIIEEINKRFCQWVIDQGKDYTLAETAIIYDNQIRMANLSIVGSHNVNGVSKLHSDILVESTFRAFNELYPTKFGNVTNGIAHRRWLGQANPELASYLKDLIGDDFVKDLSKISKLNDYKNDKKVVAKLQEIKKVKKEQLATYIQNTTGITVNPDSIFDVQVKRLHEYKRQLLNALHIVYLYREIKYNGLRPVPRTFIFAAKASSGYQMAKNIIKFIHSISQMIECDELVREYIKVVFLPDYKVTLSEKIIPAADISEQISQAGKEASGTGNMKLMLNGALTLGTLDGANVEIHEAVGDENIFIFGLETPEVDALNVQGYKPWEYYNNSDKIKETLDFIRTMTVGGMNFNFIVDYLLTQDHYMCLADFDSYVEAQERIEKDFNDSSKWMKMSLANIANAGIFSADRSVKEYAKDIWHIKPVQG